MAEVTGLRIGARASCSDGFCGEVTRIVIDPATRTISHLVIEPRHRREPGRLVPLDLVDVTDGQVRVRCTIAEFGHLELAQEVDLEEGFDYDAGMGVGSGFGTSMASGPRMVTHDAVPLGETELLPGEHVHALDGEIGRVQGFVVDAGDHQVTHVLLQEGHLWGRRDVAIPASAVTKVENGIWINLTKEQVEDLPPAN